ncbi:MAG: orotate phosphoribosyltransferase [Ignavibacteria bacterium]|nr:orotate phosphoribosyltransferase [Ignavibacteria bacterium]
MERNELARQIYNISHITGDFLLRSGVRSSEYFDKYQFESEPDLLKEIAVQLAGLLPEKFDVLAGLEMGGIPLATALSLETSKPLVFVRKHAKEYGTCKFAEGHNIEGKVVVAIEDVVTSGGQLLQSVDDLRQLGAQISVALCVIDRQAGGSEALAKKGIELKPLFKMSELKEFK